MPFVFPTHLFNPRKVSCRLVETVLSGGTSIIGESDEVAADGGGRWLVTMSDIELVTPDAVRAWRAWEDECGNGIETVYLPVPDIAFAPRPLIGGKLARPQGLVFGGDNPYFPTSAAFDTPLIRARTTAAQILRDVYLGIEIQQGAALRGGEVFGVTHVGKGPRLYRTRRTVDGKWRISPPLRDAVASGAAINFDWPLLSVRIVPNSMQSPEIENRAANVSVQFREAP